MYADSQRLSSENMHTPKSLCAMLPRLKKVHIRTGWSVYNQSDVHTLEMFAPYKFQLLPFCKSNVYYILLRNIGGKET